MEENNTSDFTLYILLCVSGLLVVIDGLELLHLIYNWQYGFLIMPQIFEKCIKYELISKTIFSIFSFIAAFSAFFLTLFLLSAQNFFLGKLLKPYLYTNYIFFGPMMVALSLLGIYHWEEVVYVCDKNNLKIKEVSVSNSVTIIGCFLISVFLTVLIEFFESFNFLLDSILKRDSGSHTLGKFFWHIVLSRANQARMRSYNGNNNNNNNGNINNNNSNQNNVMNDRNNGNNNVNNQDTVLNLNNNNISTNNNLIGNNVYNENILNNNVENNIIISHERNLNIENQGNLENERLLYENHNNKNEVSKNNVEYSNLLTNDNNDTKVDTRIQNNPNDLNNNNFKNT